MASREEKRRDLRLLPALLLLAVFCIFYVCAITGLTPQRYNVRAGDVAHETITSPRTIENTQATQTLREIARNEIETIYVLDEELISEYTAGAEKFFNDIDTFRQDADIYRANSALYNWREIINEANMLTLLSRFDVEITTDEGYLLLEAEKSEILRLRDAVLPKLTTSLAGGLEEQTLEARKTAYLQELNLTSISDVLKSLGEKAFGAYLKPTFVADEKATNQARETAAAAVKPVEVKRGDIIVRQNETITQQQYETMRMLELIRADNADMWLYIGVALYALIIAVCFYLYLYIFRRNVLYSLKDTLIIAASMAISILLAFALNTLDKRICASLLGVLLVTLLVGHKTALAVNAVLALCLGLLGGGRGSSMMGFDSMLMTVSCFIGGQAAIYTLSGHMKRGAIISAGAIAGAASSVTVAAVYIMMVRTPYEILLAVIWPFCSNLVASLLVAGILPFFETLFDVATSARLNELSNTNNPLLKQLMTEAPGTYHHSMMTAALAESAAEAIGADALLARVGSYYHDVGKLRRPMFFKENQKPNENIHDTLPPLESASIIIAHQKDGVNMLGKYKLPTAVMQIAFEHHGTTLAAYFYHKAVEAVNGKPVPQKPFRYPGARPSTKESAIVLLADSCEAAVRSLNSPSREEVEVLVEKIIKGKIEDGQLALSPLNFKEVTVIQQSFLRTFNGLLHERIAYPELKPDSK